MSKSAVPAAGRRIKQSELKAARVRPDLPWLAYPGDVIMRGPCLLKNIDPVESRTPVQVGGGLYIDLAKKFVSGMKAADAEARG